MTACTWGAPTMLVDDSPRTILNRLDDGRQEIGFVVTCSDRQHPALGAALDSLG
jgi:hypothetical protein